MSGRSYGDSSGTPQLTLETRRVEARLWLSTHTTARPWRGWCEIPAWCEIAGQALEIIDGNRLFTQPGRMLCGPTAAMVILSRQAPRQFVKAVYQMYTTGSFAGLTKSGPMSWLIGATSRTADSLRGYPIESLEELMAFGLRAIGTPYRDGFDGESQPWFEGSPMETGSTEPVELLTWIQRLTGWQGGRQLAVVKSPMAESFISFWNKVYNPETVAGVVLTNDPELHYVVLASRFERCENDDYQVTVLSRGQEVVWRGDAAHMAEMMHWATLIGARQADVDSQAFISW